MKGIVKLIVFVVFWVLIWCGRCQESYDTPSSPASVYMVTLKQAPLAFNSYKFSKVKKNKTHHFQFPDSNSGGANTFQNPRWNYTFTLLFLLVSADEFDMGFLDLVTILYKVSIFIVSVQVSFLGFFFFVIIYLFINFEEYKFIGNIWVVYVYWCFLL